MYGSRKTKVRFAQNQLEGRLVTGVALGGAGEGLVPRARSQTSQAPKAPPSPSPPSPQPPGELSSDDDEEDEYTRQLREQTKAQLESITGRMFQVLNDYEGDGEGMYIEDQVNMLENTALKNNIQLMIADYKDMCSEREDVLSSLADWFEEGHVDDLLQEVKDRRMSVAADPEGLRKSLMEGKKASEKLKVINEQLEEANSHGLPTSELKLQKEELEKELMITMQLVEGGQQKQQAEPISTAVKDSWKFAAVEICDLLHQVRDSGLEDIQFMESKINNLLGSMNEQSEVIEKLNNELQVQRQHAVFSDMTTSKLSGDNSLLKEEVDMLRGQLLDAKETINSMGLDLKCNARELEGLKNKKKTVSAKGKRSHSKAEDIDMITAKYEIQLSKLSMQAETLQQEKETLILECAELQEQLEEARDLFEEEAADHKAELETVMSVQPETSSSRSLSRSETDSPATTTAPRRESVNTIQEDTQVQTPAKPVLPVRKASVQIGNTHTERRSIVPHSVDHYRVQLIERDTQLRVAHKEAERLTGLLKNMEEEMRKMRRENTELVKLHERSAAVINQASTCLQIKGDAEEGRSSVSSYEKPATVTSTLNSSVPHSSNTPTHADHATSSMAEGVHEPRIHHTTTPVNMPEETVVGQAGSPLPVVSSNAPQTQPAASDPPPSYWSVIGSVDEKSSLKEMTGKDKGEESLQLVLNLLEKVNANQSDFATADSKALSKVHFELQKVCKVIKSFLEYSTDLVNREAEVVSGAVDSLMTQLPEEEKPSLTGSIAKPNLQHQRKSVYEASYADRKILKERVVHFADQAIEVLKAGERVLTTKLNTQQKNLQTVLHAMEEHKRRQSQAFKFEAPDMKGLVLEAHAVSSHNVSHEHSHEKEQQSQRERQEKLELLRQYAATRSLVTSHLQRKAGYPFRGLRNGLFGLTMSPFMVGAMQGGSTGHGADGLSISSNRTQLGMSPRQQTNMLQINATHHEKKPAATQQSFSYSARPQTQQSTQVAHHFQPEQDHAAISTTKKGRRKPKLYKPFHFNEPVTTGSYIPPLTAPAKTRGGDHRSKATNKNTASQGAHSRAATSQKKSRGAVLTGDKNLGERSYSAQQSTFTTFTDLLSYPTSVSKGQHHNLAGDAGVKLPPI